MCHGGGGGGGGGEGEGERRGVEGRGLMMRRKMAGTEHPEQKKKKKSLSYALRYFFRPSFYFFNQ
jgi:hypothetical protein